MIGLQTGSQINTDIINRAKYYIKKHFEDKGFNNCEVEIMQREDVTGDNKVIVDININKNEKIKIHRIHITGLDDKKERIKVKKAMKKTREHKLYNFFRSKKYVPEKFEEDKANTIEKLNGWGFRDALLVADSVVNIDEKHVDIYLHYYQGKKYYLRNVSWVGNTVYTSDLMERILKMQKGDVYDMNLLNKRLRDEDDAVANLYYNNGYVFSSVNPVEINIDNDSIDLEIRINEGRQATFNHVRIAGNDRVYENVIRRELRTKPGDLFSMDAIKRSVQDLAQMNQFDPEALQAELGKNIKPKAATKSNSLPDGDKQALSDASDSNSPTSPCKTSSEKDTNAPDSSRKETDKPCNCKSKQTVRTIKTTPSPSSNPGSEEKDRTSPPSLFSIPNRRT